MITCSKPMDAFQSYADEVVGTARKAADLLRRFDQEETDRLVEAAFQAAFEARIDLGRLAFEETGMGVLEHKVIKNAWASLLIYEHIRSKRTVGILSHDTDRGITEVAQPIGPVLALTPVTNPTSTVIFKALIASRPAIRSSSAPTAAPAIAAGRRPGSWPRRRFGRALPPARSSV